jgi:hypothetical protein
MCPITPRTVTPHALYHSTCLITPRTTSPLESYHPTCLITPRAPLPHVPYHPSCLPHQSPGRTPTALVPALRTAAQCVHRLVGSGVAPRHHWPAVLEAAGACGLWTCPVGLLSPREVQEIIMDVRGGAGLCAGARVCACVHVCVYVLQ